MNGVIDAAVVGAEAAEHLTVRGVYNRVAAKRGDVAFPEIEPLLHGLQAGSLGDSFLQNFLLQIRILYFQKILADRLRHTDIEKRAQEVFLRLFTFRDFHTRISRLLGKQFFD